jgi:formylglycine-generating enzyme required for sulfatase activity
MTAKDNFWHLTGYRLPTEAEWEFACRAGTSTSRYYGLSESLLPRYAWYLANGQNRTHRVAGRKPNDFGLFDMYGNVLERCYDAYDDYPESNEEAASDSPSVKIIEDTDRRVLRGGTLYGARAIRSADRFNDLPNDRYYFAGFRPARTYHLEQPVPDIPKSAARRGKPD